MKKNSLITPTEITPENDHMPLTKKAWTKPSLLLLELSQTNEKIPGGFDSAGQGNLKTS